MWRLYYLDHSLYIGIVKQSADFIGHAQIEIQVKKFFKGQLEETFRIQSCQKPNEIHFLTNSRSWLVAAPCWEKILIWLISAANNGAATVHIFFDDFFLLMNFIEL